MKIAVLSDIHGNLPAFETVLAHIDAYRPDLVVVNGDVVNRGPKSAECWQIIADRLNGQGSAKQEWVMTRGNHEEYVLEWDEPRPNLTSAERDIFQSSLWTFEQLPASAIAHFKTLPDSHSRELFDSAIRWNHASPRGTRDGIGPWTTDNEIREKMAPAPDIFFTAHTHRAFVREVGATRVVNSGSVGCPLDGDKRASYVQLSWQKGWQIDPIRLDYDREQTQRDFDACDFREVCGSTGQLMHLEWDKAQSFIPAFFQQYHQAINDESLTPTEAAKLFMQANA